MRHATHTTMAPPVNMLPEENELVMVTVHEEEEDRGGE